MRQLVLLLLAFPFIVLAQEMDTLEANNLFLEAEEAMTNGDYESSKNKFETAALIFEKNEMWERFVSGLNKTSEVFFSDL